ncbi:Golgi SNAP receptor complex member 2 [Cimex lectularius]|uniref:Golgi SNAP receptor complex member 2 n=1 Tax=Cimex lectularius TaxID=79782 RepID=A0A8I6TCK1_CIMLE|nr:Golgi SNAP receptor complex member 2 [Cimex lectularius]
MESLYHKTNGLVQETHDCFQRLEKLKGSDTDSIEAEIQARIDTITSNCERLDILVHKEPVTRRQNARLRIDQLKYDNKHLQTALKAYQYEAYKRKQVENERAELLSRRFTHNSKLNEEDTTIMIDHSLQHNMSLQNAHRGMDDMLNSGSSILENMRYQRNTLKGARKRMMDIASTLGLSNTTMRLIEKRAIEDKYILIALMVVTLLIIVLLLIYF